MHLPNKVLVIGSGALKIGQAGEFDYSGSQALKALKEEGIKTVLINPNIATVQTSENLADKIYFLPITSEFVEKVIKKESPDSILLNFGGQTALNCGVELYKKGIFKKYNIKVLGTPISAIEDTEDRERFIKRLGEINVKTALSKAVNNIKDALKAAKKINYPVMLRSAYSLGGLGSGVCKDEKELKDKASKAFSLVPQVLIEEYIGGWKEVEYEVVRDSYDNCITVCNMENFDPMGIHTGESIVVAPSQTLNDYEYHKLREISTRVIRHLGIIGECNIQFALDPYSEDYRVIEVNARLSRSSALASKATGYPLAFIASKLSLGYSLIEIKNPMTKTTTACFEPSLDYIVVKMPRWDLQKFNNVDQKLGSEMKSVGEIMSIGRNFEEAIQKAIRMLNIGMNGLSSNDYIFESSGELDSIIKSPTDKRIYAIAEALRKEYNVEDIVSVSKINRWFISCIKNIIDTEKKISGLDINNLDRDTLRYAKKLGFSDKQISLLINVKEEHITSLRNYFGIFPNVKQIDTMAAEYPAKTNYLYLTYNASRDDLNYSKEQLLTKHKIKEKKKKIIVLGSGAYRIGSSVEFDWCCVNAIKTIRDNGHEAIVINYNPETVSTDYDISDKLYFDELSLETVMDIYKKEKADGIIISVGGQIANNLALPLHKAGVKIYGTTPKSIDGAENRYKFSQMLDDLGIDQPEWKELTDLKQAKVFCNKVSYPVLVRPSYVLSGAAMSVVLNDKELDLYLKKASDISKDHPVVISKFIRGAKEIELDAVADCGDLIAYAISEHIENAGVHSGDATMVLPAQKIYLETAKKIKDIAKKIAQMLNITGPFNMQFIAKDNDIKVIECNLRSSRSFPFASKIYKVNFIELATKAMLGIKYVKPEKSHFELDYVGIKAPQFSFSRLKGADPVLGVEMASTGEVACIGKNVKETFLKSVLSTGIKIPNKNILLSTGHIKYKADLLKYIKILDKLKYNLFATKGTAKFLKEHGINATVLYWPDEKTTPNVIDFIKNKRIDLVVNIPKDDTKRELDNDYKIRRTAVDFDISLITNAQLAKMFISSLDYINNKEIEIKSWDEY